jgi:hypothetical protein
MTAPRTPSFAAQALMFTGAALAMLGVDQRALREHTGRAPAGSAARACVRQLPLA